MILDGTSLLPSRVAGRIITVKPVVGLELLIESIPSPVDGIIEVVAFISCHVHQVARRRPSGSEGSGLRGMSLRPSAT